MKTWQRGLAASFAVLIAGCGLDGGIKPLQSAIEGEITFVGAWPDSLVEVRVVAYADYPPAKFTDLTAWSDPLPIGESSVHYRVSLPPGEYALVVLVGRYTGRGWTPLEEFNPSGRAIPDTVRLADRKSLLTGVDFTVTFTAAVSGISGRIIFANAWPDTISSIRVGALYGQMTDPRTPPITFADIEHLSRVFVKDDTSYVYSIELPPGTYRTIGVAWMSYRTTGEPEAWDNLTDVFKLPTRPVLGVYSKDNSLVPDSVVVEPNVWIPNLDITVDFTWTRM